MSFVYLILLHAAQQKIKAIRQGEVSFVYSPHSNIAKTESDMQKTGPTPISDIYK